MRKCRYFPFGYKMEDGCIIPDKKESEKVAEIFTLYLMGHSYLSIAQLLSADSVPYHSYSSQWNKNMVKRILEDTRYLGGKYPALIEPHVFEDTQNLIQKKSHPRKKKYTRKGKTEFVCGECGKGLDTSKWEQKQLSCQNPNCSLYETRITEAHIAQTFQPSDSYLKLQTELKIQWKTEMSELEPKEEILLRLSEELADIRFRNIPIADRPQEYTTWEDLLRAKRVIVYTDKVQII